MRWSRTIQTVDVHCEGEIGRVITGGMLNIPGATMAEFSPASPDEAELPAE